MTHTWIPHPHGPETRSKLALLHVDVTAPDELSSAAWDSITSCALGAAAVGIGAVGTAMANGVEVPVALEAAFLIAFKLSFSACLAGKGVEMLDQIVPEIRSETRSLSWDNHG